MFISKGSTSNNGGVPFLLKPRCVRDADKKIEEIRNIDQSHSTVVFCLEIWNHFATFSDIFYLKFILTTFIRDHPPMYLPFSNVQRVGYVKRRVFFQSWSFQRLYLLSVGCFDLPKGTYVDPKGTNSPISSKLNAKHSTFL